MSVLEITLTNGSVITADVSSWTWDKTADKTRLEWTTPDRGKRRRLVYVAPLDIAAIVEIIR